MRFIFRTERLLLRPFTLDDAAEVARLCNDRAVTDGTLSLPYPYPIAAARGWIAAQAENLDLERSIELAVTDGQTGALYGCVSLALHGQNAELGYWIGQAYWDRGYATESAARMLQWAFAEKGLHRVYARHFASNPASGRVMQKLGMACEGVMREHIFKNNAYQDVVFYGILNKKS